MAKFDSAGFAIFVSQEIMKPRSAFSSRRKLLRLRDGVRLEGRYGASKFLWIVVGVILGVFLFMLLSVVSLKDDRQSFAPPGPSASPPKTAATPEFLTGTPDEQNDPVAQVPFPPSPPESLPTPLAPLDKAMVAAHQKMVTGFIKDLREQTGKVYGTIFKQLNLPADVQQKVIDILIQPQQKLEQQAFEAAQSGSFPAPPSPQEIQTQQAQQDNQLRAVLGDVGFAQFNQYQATIPDRTIIDQMNQQGANLSDSQSQQLLQILTDARAQIQNSTPNLSSLPPDQALAAIQKQQVLLQQTVNDRIQSVLTPDQGKTLQGAFSRLSTAP